MTAAVSPEANKQDVSHGRLIAFISFVARYSLLLFICWQLAQISWWVLGYEDSGYRLSLPDVTSDHKAHNNVSVASAIGLFGTEGRSETKTEAKAVDAPETRLRLELMGVVTARENSSSGAIIAEKGRDAQYFRVGEKLPGNAELVEVYDDRVLLRRLGKMETLRFSEFAKGSSNSRNTVTSSRRNASDIKTPEDFLGEAERRLSKDPIGALNSVGLRPVAGASADGYVYNGRNPMLNQMNLKKGDVIRSVNGYPMGDVQKDRALLKQFYEQGSVMVEIERDGTFFSINYPLR